MVFQCKDEPCLRFHGTSAGSGKIFFLHHLPLAVGDGLVVLSCFFQTENCGRFGNDLGTCRIVDVSDVGFVRRPVNAVCNGPGTVKRMGHPDVAPLYEMKKSLDWEVDKFQGFVRFEEHDGMLGAVIHPKNYILPLLRGHFCSRFPEENFMIYDAVHQAVLLYQEHKAQLLELAAPLELPPPSAREQEFQALWKQFYDTLEIKARHNEKGRMTHCPKRFWQDMVEMR